jgi:hypothetical protein
MGVTCNGQRDAASHPDLELDRPTPEDGGGGLAGEPVAQNNLKTQISYYAGDPFMEDLATVGLLRIRGLRCFDHPERGWRRMPESVRVPVSAICHLTRRTLQGIR